MAIASTQVGEFFRLGEFIDRRAGRLPPGDSPIHLARLCCVVLDPMRRRFGVTTVNSGYRTPASNATVGGAAASRHLYDRFETTPAVDFRCATGNPGQWANYAIELLGRTGGVGTYKTHVHVDRRSVMSRWSG